MNHISLQFSDLMSVAYNTDTNTLEIFFKDGNKRRYINVPSTIYFSLLNAYSPDRYYEKYISSMFNFVSIK